MPDPTDDPDERPDDTNEGAPTIERETNVDFHVTDSNEDDG